MSTSFSAAKILTDGEYLQTTETASGLSFGRALWLFCRPESTTGSVIMTLSVCLAVIPHHTLQDAIFRILALIALVPLWTICAHGVNQIYDLEVDKVNKPHFPLPSKALSITQAWFISVGTGAIASLLGFYLLPVATNLPFLIGMLIATITYSVPWFGVRKSIWLPKFIGISFRGALWPMVSYIGACEITRATVDRPEHFGFILSFAVLFCIGMNTFEDIPDIEGDRRLGYASFAQKLGPVRTAYICFGTFLLAYAILILWQFSAPQLFSVSLGVVAIVAFLVLFCFRFRQLIPQLHTNIAEAKPFYQFLWLLYCAQYLLLPVLFRHP